MKYAARLANAPVQARRCLLERVDCSCHNEPEQGERDRRLQQHRVLRTAGERHDVGRAERRRVREAKMQVVEEHGPPARRCHFGAELLYERKVDRDPLREARNRPAAIDQPVQEPEREVVAKPHDRPEASSSSGEFVTPLPRIRSETRGRRPQRRHDQRADENQRDSMQPLDDIGSGQVVRQEHDEQPTSIAGKPRHAIAPLPGSQTRTATLRARNTRTETTGGQRDSPSSV